MLAILFAEQRKLKEQGAHGDITSSKIDQLALRLDEGLENLRDVQWEMRDSEVRYRDLLDNQLDIILRRDRNGRLSFINDAFCQTFGQQIRTKSLVLCLNPNMWTGSKAVALWPVRRR